jgi:hypothetical protein
VVDVSGQLIVALVLAFLVVKFLGRGRARSVRHTSSAPPTRSPSSERRRSARHEAAHLVVNRKLGGHDKGAELWNDSNGISHVYPKTWRGDAIMSLAGEAAAGSRGAESDRAFARKACRKAGMSMGEARREARRLVSRHSGEINSTARKLARNGRV